MKQPIERLVLCALLILILSFSGCNNARPPTSTAHSPINTPGQRVELRNHLTAGKTNIFYFYADW